MIKKLFTLLLLTVFVLPVFGQNEKTEEVTTYYLIRHAEKDRSDASNKNPHLLEKGIVRAKHWDSVFKKIHFDAVYSTDYHRTRETAKPTAASNNLELTIYNPKTLDMPRFLNATKGKNVLIVGHSNSTPNFVNTLLGEKKYQHINDSNNGNLYIVTIINNKTSDQVLEIN